MGKRNRRRSARIGRNDKCHCGSGIKYKLCHGKLESLQALPDNLEKLIKQKLAEHEATLARNKSQQGLAKPIISEEFNGYRFVAVRSKMHYSNKWRTFHDFIFSYIGIVLGEKIGNSDLRKPRHEQHPISQWHQDCCAYQEKEIEIPGKIHSSDSIGVYSQYMHLSYNLYLMEHNEKLQDVMISRLLDKNSFWGALYETFVLAKFLLADFEIELEDEDDSSTSHVEFVATHKPTGDKFSVEAKSRIPGKEHSHVNRQLYKALKKYAKFKRVVFIDLNITETDVDLEKLNWPVIVNQEFKEQETKMKINGQPAPPAYVFVTNQTANSNPNSVNPGSANLAIGFKIGDFASTSPMSLMEAVEAREKHIAMHDLMKSMKEHSNIPSTFDGEIPEFAFGSAERRFNIGNSISIPMNAQNTDTIEGILEDAIVNEEKGTVICIVRSAENNPMVEIPLTDEEILAYKAHPDTFFGILRKVSKGITHPLEAYDFFHESYKNTPKERLLEFMKNNHDYELLLEKSQEELAKIYSERMANYMLSRSGQFSSSLE